MYTSLRPEGSHTAWSCGMNQVSITEGGISPLQAQGFRADGAQYSAVLAALMAAGVLPAQLKALQLFQTALRQGILRCTLRANK